MAGHYFYPFSSSATEGRIDQGQDFGGTGAILAIGDARIIKTGAPGWPGGHGVLYRLLNGPAAGRIVFVYEGIKVKVRPGQLVRGGQEIGTMIPGSSTGVEIGFADKNGVPLSHAEYTEGKETRFGKEMAAFLDQLKPAGGGGLSLGGLYRDTLDLSTRPFTGGIEEGLEAAGKVLGGPVGAAASDIAGQTISKLADLLGVNAPAILLNIGLVGGGAFLTYYGIARAVGVNRPVGTPLKAATHAGEAVAVMA